MAIEIKEVTTEDIKELMDWRMEVVSKVFHGQEYDPKDLYNENLKYFEKALKQDSYIGVFALMDNKIVGCGGACLYDELPSPDNPTGTCAYLMNIYVRENYRNKGIGGHIVKYIVKKARQRGIGKIYLESTEEAYPLYRKLGFSPMQGFLKLD